MKSTIKYILLCFITALFLFSGCGGGGGSSSSGTGRVSISQEVTGSSYDITRNYVADNLSSEDRCVLIASSHQKEKAPDFNYSAAVSKGLPGKGIPLKEIFYSEKTTEGAKDLDLSLVKYAESANKSGIYDKNKTKSLKVYNEGDEEEFNILLNGSAFGKSSAKCYKKGIHCYVFIDTSSENILEANRAEAAAKIASAFDSDNSPFNPGAGIYDCVRNYFGGEWSPGIDADEKIFILISPKLGNQLYGYFYSLDEIDAENSNKKEIIYVNDDLFGGNMYNGLATIAHEFEHLVNYNMKFNIGGNFEETVISEGSAVMSEYLNGFKPEKGGSFSGNGYIIRYVNNFLANPSNFYFYYWNKDYGAAFLFMLYVMERYGEDTFKSIQKSQETGAANIEGFTGISFSALFREWMLVNYYSGLGGNPVLPSGSAHAKYDNFNPKGAYEGYSTKGNSAVESYVLNGISFKSEISGASGKINLGHYNCSYFNIIPVEGNLLFTYKSKSEYATYSDFIIEKPARTFYSLQ